MEKGNLNTAAEAGRRAGKPHRGEIGVFTPCLEGLVPYKCLCSGSCARGVRLLLVQLSSAGEANDFQELLNVWTVLNLAEPQKEIFCNVPRSVFMGWITSGTGVCTRGACGWAQRAALHPVSSRLAASLGASAGQKTSGEMHKMHKVCLRTLAQRIR